MDTISCNTGGPAQRLTWLQLVDWHQKEPELDRQLVRDALIRGIRNWVQIDPHLQQVDFVVFSGEVAFSGSLAENEAARQYLFYPVLEAVGLRADHLCFVPGNHGR